MAELSQKACLERSSRGYMYVFLPKRFICAGKLTARVKQRQAAHSTHLADQQSSDGQEGPNQRQWSTVGNHHHHYYVYADRVEFGTGRVDA